MQPPPAPSTEAKSAIEPVAPVVPADVIAALQGGDYESARGALNALREKAKDRDDGAYHAYLQAIAERLAGQRDAARETLRKGLSANPTGRWAPKLRFELAGIELAAGNGAAAEELTRGEAVRLLAGPRKDQLAGVYQNFAQKLLEPDDPLVPPDPNAAYELMAQARELAASPGLRAQVLFSMGRASAAAGNPARRSKTSSSISGNIAMEPTASASAFRRAKPSGKLTRSCRRGLLGPTWPAISNACSRPSVQSTSPPSAPTPFMRSLRPSESPNRATTRA